MVTNSPKKVHKRSSVVVCKNCNHPFEGKFCNYCGQAANTQKLNMHFIWHDLQHSLLHFDNGIFYTIKQLLTRPGHTIREFIEGKRVRHFKPLSFVIVLATLYGLFYHYFINHLFDSTSINPNENIVNAYEKVIKWNFDHFPVANLLLILTTTIASYIVFKKKGYDLAEHLVLNTFCRGLILVVNLLFLPLVYMFNKIEVLKWYGIIVPITDIILIYWCYSQFFNKTSKISSLGLTLLTYIIMSGINLFIGYSVGWIVNSI